VPVREAEGAGHGRTHPPGDDLPDDVWRAVAARSRDFICIFRSDGTILYTNERVTEFLGWPYGEMNGTNVAEFVHPDDLERALLGIGVAVEYQPRLAPATFRLRHADGRWIRMEVNGNALVPEHPELMAVTARVSHDADLYNAVLERLSAGAPVSHVLAAVPEFTIWRNDDTLCAVTWTEESGTRRSTGSDLPSILTGVQTPPEGTSPWVHATDHRVEVLHDNLDSLPASVRAAAEARGLLGLWVIPVGDPGGGDPACITMWSAHESAPVRLSEYSARIAQQLVALILRWRHQRHLLEHAASHDGLTGLANRTAFFRTLDEGGGPPVVADVMAPAAPNAAGTEEVADAVLYIDLDGFKPINDRYGHSAGDTVLCELADRLRTSVRPTDLVGRLGGDEFAVLLRRCRTDEVQAIAHRIRERLGAPIDIGPVHTERRGAPVDIGPTTVRLSASIGVAVGGSGDSLLDAADKAQIDAKKGGGNRVRWAT
jgi:diguanylate cyclase (GGDEF)-like protein/PAS domain S-box-containing protein